jgi:hypothetical protein
MARRRSAQRWGRLNWRLYGRAHDEWALPICIG